jgi:hypothetical protein
VVLATLGRYAEAREYAERAYRADAYLGNVTETLFRLFLTSFELGDDDVASRWCDELRIRMPDQWPYAFCSLILLGWGERAGTDPRQALHTFVNFGRADGPEQRAAVQPLLAMLLAGSLANAGMPDSARAVLRRAQPAAVANPSLLEIEAAARVRLGEHDRAVELLREFLSRLPTARARVLGQRYFRPLHNHAGFKELLLETGITAGTQARR